VRRFLSIPLILLFWMAPLAALMPGSEDARLPMCCRRHGTHHCAMSGSEAPLTGGEHAVSAPAHCPLYHAGTPARIAVFLAPRHPGSGPVAVEQARLEPTRQAFPSRAGHTHSGRAPPTAC